MTTVRSASGSFAFAVARISGFLPFQILHVGIEAVEALLPETAIVADPPGGPFERRCIEANGAGLGVAAAQDEAGAFKHLQVLGDGWLAQSEGGDELVDRGLAGREPRKDRAPRRVGQSREYAVELLRGGKAGHNITDQLYSDTVI